MRILVLAEHDNENLNGVTRNAVTAAKRIGGAIDLLVVGDACRRVADEAVALAGVSRVLLVDAPHLREASPENVTAQVLALAAAYTHLVAPATSCGKSVIPRVAAALDVAPITDVISVESQDTFTRPIHAGNALHTVWTSDPVIAITVRPTAFPAAASGGSAPVEQVVALADSGRSRVVSRELTRSGRPELSSAKVVVSGGRGLGSAGNYHALLEPLADRLGAALGATRAAVDAGFVSNDHQVGQTGKIVAPDLYVAVGLSGAVQHLAGIKDSRIIVAINKDADAPIFQVADFGLVGDLFELVPELTKALG